MTIKTSKRSEKQFRLPSVAVATVPVVTLICAMVAMIIVGGADKVQQYGPWLLLGSSLIAVLLSVVVSGFHPYKLSNGLFKSARQILPSFPILVLIGTVSATWMLSGVVPMMIVGGLHVLSPSLFLFTACAVSALISLLTGSSWTTIATIGVALMGIGTVMGYSPAWIAGAIISGAYFGDKLSPLSDTTVLASSSCGVNLFAHIRYMVLTTAPSMLIALAVFGMVGLFGDYSVATQGAELTGLLAANFNLTPWLLTVPLLTAVLIVCRVNSYVTLSVSSLLGLASVFIFQPQVLTTLVGEGNYLHGALTILGTSTNLPTGSAMLDDLVSTGGVEGMLPTIFLVASAMVFGGVMIGSGMLRTITDTLNKRIHTARGTVSSTVGAGLALNACTGDQFLSIIISANMFKPLYEDNHLEGRLLSRTVEDSVSVTSVLIPWNSCGLAQSTVLGVATMTYLPYCVFNIVSPLMSLVMAWAGIRIRRIVPAGC